MPLGNWNLEFGNLNSQRRYPLADDAEGVDASGSFTIPTDFLTGLDLPVHAGNDVDPARFFILYLGAFATGYSIVVGYQPAVGDPVQVATALVPREGFEPYSSFRLGGGTDFADTAGKVVIGRLDNIDDQPPGYWTFAFDQTRLDPDAIRPIIRGVSSITCVSGTQTSEPLTGDIVLEAGPNFQITPIVVSGADPVLLLSAITGEGLVAECVCDGDAAPPIPIETIQGITPGADGNFEIVGSNCVQIETIAHGLRIVDTCSAPCCGCAELEKLTSKLQRFASEATAVSSFVDRLAREVETMDTVVLASRIGSTSGCASCS